MMPKSSERPRLGATWGDLEETGQAPTIGGRSAEEAVRDQHRKRRLMPSERRRRRHKVSPTLSTDLVEQLRQICREMGYVDEEGAGVLASPVVERFLRLAVEAYQGGMIERYENEVVTRSQELRWKASLQQGNS